MNWLSGAALMCRRTALDQVGPFDPGYFMFSEEVDLCRRMANAGWLVAYVPQAQVTHYGGGSTDQAVPERHINFNTGKARYLRIHEGATRVLSPGCTCWRLMRYRHFRSCEVGTRPQTRDARPARSYICPGAGERVTRTEKARMSAT